MKYSVSISFLAGILLFFLPFVEIKCNATTLREVKGIDLVTGFKVKDANKEDQTYNGSSLELKNERQEANEFAIAALVLAVVGLVISFINFQSQPIVSMVTAILAAISLLAMMIQIKSDVNKWSRPAKETDNDFLRGLSSIKVSADFTPWFYLSLVSFIAAAYFSYRKGLPPISRSERTHL